MSKDNKHKTFNTGGTVRHKKNIGVMIGTILILAITIVAFILVPAMTQSSNSGKNMIFGSYGKSKIQYAAGNYFARQVEYINNMYRDNETLSDNLEYKRQLVWQTAFNQTVIQKAIEEELANSGVVITDKQIDRAIVERGPFQVDGIFSEDAYKNASTQTKFDLRNRFYEELLREQYTNDVMYGTYRNDGLLDFITNMGSEEKSFNYAIFNIDSIDDSFFKNYGVANVEKFTKASLNRITIKASKDAADKMHSRITTGEISFKDAAIAESKDGYAADGGNAGELYFYELSDDVENEDFARKIFTLKDREISEVIETSYGWVIYQMIDNPVLPDTTSEDLINDIKIYMSRNEKGLIEDNLVAKGREFSGRLNGSSDFLGTASALNIENGTSGYFAINYGNNRMLPSSITSATEQNAAFSSAAYDELFLERLFSLKNKGDVSDPLILGSNIIVAQLVGTQESTVIPEEYKSYYKYQVESEVAGYMQTDLQNLVMNSPEFKNQFYTTFAALFYAN